MNDRDPKEFNLPEGQLLKPEQIDDVARALLTLTREVAVLTDRVLVLEELLERSGGVTHEQIDSFVPDEAFAERSQAAINQVVQGILSALNGT